VGIGELPARGINRILLLRPNHRLGNTLLLTPLLSELEQRFPGAEVDVLTACEAADQIFAGFRQVQQIYQLTRRPGHHPLHLLRTMRQIRRLRYDLALDSTRGSYSGRLLLSLCGARYRLALPRNEQEQRHDGGAWQQAMAQAPAHFALDSIYALRCALGTPGLAEAPYPRLRMALQAHEHAAARALLDDLLPERQPHHRVIALFPNATGAKRLPGRWWLDYIDVLRAADPTLRFVEVVAAHGQSQLESRLPAFFSSDIRKMAAMFAQCAAYISGDCGVMHLAGASGVPTLGLFMKHNLPRYRPYGPHDGALYVGDQAAADAARASQLFLRALPA
jgi:ADP-heptose:LPS heptosyltransferase